MNKKKHILILGGSSDIGIEVVKMILNLDWNVTAHYFKNKKKLEILKKNSANLKLLNFDFSKQNKEVEKIIAKKFNERYDSIINLVGYIDNKGFENTDLKSVIKSLTANSLCVLCKRSMGTIID